MLLINVQKLIILDSFHFWKRLIFMRHEKESHQKEFFKVLINYIIAVLLFPQKRFEKVSVKQFNKVILPVLTGFIKSMFCF
jgi:hypothetical protein